MPNETAAQRGSRSLEQEMTGRVGLYAGFCRSTAPPLLIIPKRHEHS
jgi:hypothetical protein